MNKIEIAILALLGLVFSGFAAPSVALGATKTMPASACQSTNEYDWNMGRGANDIALESVYFSISCPILRDNLSNTNGLSALQIKVDKGDTASRSCTAYSVDGYGNTLKSVTKSVSGSGLKVLDWGTTFNVSSSTGNAYSVVCTFGSNDFVQNLYWSEPTESATTDGKILPGTYCKPSMADFVLNRASDHVSGYPVGNGTIYQMQCPLLRDYFSSSTALQSLKLRMYHSSTATSDCTAEISESHTGYLKRVLRGTSTVGNKTLSWGTSLASVSSTAAHYGLECYMEEGDAIYSVEYSE